MRQDVAGIGGTRRIDRHVTFVDVLNDAVLVDHKGRAIAKALRFIKNSVIFHHCAFEVAEQREGKSILLGKFTIGGDTVDAETQDLRVGRFECGDTSLVRLHLLRSTSGEGQNVDGQHHVLLTFEVAEFVSLAIGGPQRKVRRLIAHL